MERESDILAEIDAWLGETTVKVYDPELPAMDRTSQPVLPPTTCHRISVADSRPKVTPATRRPLSVSTGTTQPAVRQTNAGKTNVADPGNVTTSAANHATTSAIVSEYAGATQGRGTAATTRHPGRSGTRGRGARTALRGALGPEV